MNVVLFDDKDAWLSLNPLTLTKPIAELRMGQYTFSERWKKILGIDTVSYLTQEYLSKKYPCVESEDTLYINASVFPTIDFIEAIKQLNKGQMLGQEGITLATRGNILEFTTTTTNYEEELLIIKNPWDIFSNNKQALEFDFALSTKDRVSQKLSDTVQVIGDKSKIFVEEGAVVECCILNTKEGAVYIGKDVEIMEGSVLRGPIALCEGAKVNMGAKIYGETTVGPYSKVGGEVNNAVIMGYSNKGHDGFLGNSVLGEWCNLGADTNTSNLKNNYSIVKSWSYKEKNFVSTGLQFSGLIMGDHSKSAINTQFNTGTVVGVSSNVFVEGFPSKFIDSFSWGDKDGNYDIEKACEVAEKVMKRRGVDFTQEDKDILIHISNNKD